MTPNLCNDQLLMLAVAGFGPSPMRCEFAEKYATTPSMIGLIRDQLVRIAPGDQTSRPLLKATDRGLVLLKAMECLPLPVCETKWSMPC